MEEQESLLKLQKRYERLTAALVGCGPILQGTITPRTIERGDPQNRRVRKKYGPYYQWTWKQDGKTVTVNLTAQQAETFGQAINNHRRLEKTIEAMRKLSRLILEASTAGVKRRKLPA
jgi:hypothetical protein